MEVVQQQMIKGGHAWLDIVTDRKPGGLEIYLKADPRIEELMKALSMGGGTQGLAEYGKVWTSVGEDIRVYELGQELTSTEYFMNGIGLYMRDAKGRFNLSMLRFVGLSNGSGVRFVINGPHSMELARSIPRNISEATRNLVKEYIVPVHVELRISEKVF